VHFSRESAAYTRRYGAVQVVATAPDPHNLKDRVRGAETTSKFLRMALIRLQFQGAGTMPNWGTIPAWGVRLQVTCISARESRTGQRFFSNAYS
jgi:hypothetical protein